MNSYAYGWPIWYFTGTITLNPGSSAVGLLPAIRHRVEVYV
jgi:hypothetical protein